MRTTLNPDCLILLKSCQVTHESQCFRRTFSAASRPNFSPSVYSSTMSCCGRFWFAASKIEGVIHLNLTVSARPDFLKCVPEDTHGSRTNHPPILTPLIFSSPHLKFTPRFSLQIVSQHEPACSRREAARLAVATTFCPKQGKSHSSWLTHIDLRWSCKRSSAKRKRSKYSLDYHIVVVWCIEKLLYECGMRNVVTRNPNRA